MNSKSEFHQPLCMRVVPTNQLSDNSKRPAGSWQSTLFIAELFLFLTLIASNRSEREFVQFKMSHLCLKILTVSLYQLTRELRLRNASWIETLFYFQFLSKAILLHPLVHQTNNNHVFHFSCPSLPAKAMVCHPHWLPSTTAWQNPNLRANLNPKVSLRPRVVNVFHPEVVLH